MIEPIPAAPILIQHRVKTLPEVCHHGFGQILVSVTPSSIRPTNNVISLAFYVLACQARFHGVKSRSEKREKVLRE
jgi:hypothetical protein